MKPKTYRYFIRVIWADTMRAQVFGYQTEKGAMNAFFKYSNEENSRGVYSVEFYERRIMGYTQQSMNFDQYDGLDF